jgi:hypothetical protein
MRFSRLDWAQWMASRGINVFVCTPHSKRPLEGRSWYLHQSNDPDTIERWFAEVPDCNYGLALGAEYVVIDLDRKPGINGVAEFEKLCAENGIEDFTLDLDTLMVQTPGGGWHIYFKSEYPCSNKNLFPEGIDVRGVQGYVVGPGSADSRGEWEVLQADAPIMDLPGWLDEFVVEPGYKDPNRDVPLIEMDQSENLEYAREWLKTRRVAIEGQNGDDWTYQTIQYLRDFGVSESEAQSVIRDWNQRCEPPWDLQELEVKVRNAWNHGQNRPGCKAPTYKAQRVLIGHGQGLWAEKLTPEQIAEMFKPSTKLELVVDNTIEDDDEIPYVTDDDEDMILEGETAETFSFKTMEEFVNGESVRQYIIYEWLLADRVTHMVAKRGTGKSTIALDMACHIATDKPWWGNEVQTGWKVLYICGEDDVGMRLNARAWCQEWTESPADMSKRMIWTDDVIKLNDLGRLKLRVAELKRWADGAPVLVVLDTWQRATSGWGKNDAEAMEEAVERAEFITRSLGGAMLSLSHPPKDGRMTVKGAGEQEDTSVGIYHIEEVSDGVRMRIERIKGPGHNKYIKFRFNRPRLDGEDAFGKPLTGQIVEKIGGSEDQNTIEAMDRHNRQLRAWGDAIYDLKAFLGNPNEYEPLGEKNYVINNVARVLSVIAQDANDKANEDAIWFKENCLNTLMPYISGEQATYDRLRGAMEELFKDVKKPPVVQTDRYTMEYVLKNKTNPKGHRFFQVTPVTI